MSKRQSMNEILQMLREDELSRGTSLLGDPKTFAEECREWAKLQLVKAPPEWAKKDGMTEQELKIMELTETIRMKDLEIARVARHRDEFRANKEHNVAESAKMYSRALEAEHSLRCVVHELNTIAQLADVELFRVQGNPLPTSPDDVKLPRMDDLETRELALREAIFQLMAVRSKECLARRIANENYAWAKRVELELAKAKAEFAEKEAAWGAK